MDDFENKLEKDVLFNLDRIRTYERNKAIDDFVIAIICELKNKYTGMPIVDIFGIREKWKENNIKYLEFENLVYKIAEQLKEGGKSGTDNQ